MVSKSINFKLGEYNVTIFMLNFRFKPSLAAIKATSKTSMNSQYRNADVSNLKIQKYIHFAFTIVNISS